MVVLTGPGTPYITPDVLKRAPTGIDWTSIPSLRSSGPEQASEISNLCLRATGMADVAANQVLRATLDVEYFSGPDWRVTTQNTSRVVRVQCSRWPILQVVAGQVSPSVMFPRQWQTIAANLMDVEKPPIGVFGASQAADSSDGGDSILMAPGALDWSLGRNGWRIMLQYISGWPHTSLTSGVAAGVQTVAVDDVTGWGPAPANASSSLPGAFGATGMAYDGMFQEVVQVVGATGLAGAVAGPGTLQLASPLSFPHGNGVLISTMPQVIVNACIDYAASMALERGATATVIQSMSGGGGDSGGPVSAAQLRTWADAACSKFARVW